MKQCINKLLLLIAVSTTIAGSHLHSMEQDASAISTTTSVVSSTTTLLEEFRALPHVLRRYIIFLALEDRLRTIFTCSSILTGHTESIFSVAFSPDGKTVLTGSSG